MTDRMSGQQGQIRSPSGGTRPAGSMPSQGVAFGTAGTSSGRMPRGAAQRPPSASGALRGRPGPSADPRYAGMPAPVPQAPLAPRSRPTTRGPIVAPVLALAGLIAIGGLSVWGISVVGSVGAGAEASPTPLFAALPGASPGADGLVEESFAPEPAMSLNPVLVTPPPDQRATVRGTILFVRQPGDIYAASGGDIRALTSGQFDSSPTWSPDGKRIYFIRTRVRSTNKTREGGKYTFYIPVLMRMDANGGKRKPVYDGLINGPNGQWFSHILQPDVSPNGKTIAVVSDGPNGSGPVVLHTLSSKGGKLRRVGGSITALGDNDPAWSPDGQQIVFTHNRRQDDDGAPALSLLNVRTGRTKTLKAGYAHASWSPDGKWLAAELTTGRGRDIVILDAKRGDELARLTTDGDSFAPVVSPDGDQVAYLRRDGLSIDLRLATLSVDDRGRITLVDDRAVTDDGAIDAASSPAWFIPEEERVPEADDELVDPGALQASAAD